MSGKTRPSQRAKVLSNVDYSNLSYTDKKFIHDMFALAESQQAEIERLSNSAKQWEDTAKDLFISKEKQQAEIERLQGTVEMYEEERKYHFEMSKQKVDETVKEFTERLMDKAELVRVNAFDSKWAISDEEIDNLVKEMVGEDK